MQIFLGFLIVATGVSVLLGRTYGVWPSVVHYVTHFLFASVCLYAMLLAEGIL